MFGVGNGTNYDGLRDYYLDPANLAKLDDDLFEQVRISTDNVDGVFADRTRPIYAPILIARSEEHTSELQSLMRISYAVFCLKKKNNTHKNIQPHHLYTK